MLGMEVRDVAEICIRGMEQFAVREVIVFLHIRSLQSLLA